MRAFKKDAVMIEAAETAFTAFLDLPLKFGMISTEAGPEAWRLTSYWFGMLAEHINIIITSPGPTSNDDISDALGLVVLLSDKLAFAHFHTWHVTERLLKPVAGFEDVCIELECFVVLGLLARHYDQSLLYRIQKLLVDYIVHELPGGRMVRRGGFFGGVGGGGGGGAGAGAEGAGARLQNNHEPNFFSFSSLNAAAANDSPLPSLDPRPQTDSVQCEVRYLSESVWRNYCARVMAW